MRKIILLLAISLLTLNLMGQERVKSTKELRKQEKIEKKIRKAEELEVKFDSIKTLIEDRFFAIEADMIQLRSKLTNINLANNFIKVMGDQVIIQTSNPDQVGLNGHGGITIPGTIFKYEVTEEKESFLVLINVATSAVGNMIINMNIDNHGNARASLRVDFGRRATFIGKITPIDDLNQFVGSTRFLPGYRIPK